MIMDGTPFEAARRLRHMIKEVVLRLSTTSRWTALFVAHTNIHMWALVFLPCCSRMLKLPVWSTPTLVNGGTHLTRSAGRGGGSGLGMVLSFTLWQTTHLRRKLLMSERIFWCPATLSEQKQSLRQTYMIMRCMNVMNE